jgi:hypothetical protein
MPYSIVFHNSAAIKPGHWFKKTCVKDVLLDFPRMYSQPASLVLDHSVLLALLLSWMGRQGGIEWYPARQLSRRGSRDRA